MEYLFCYRIYELHFSYLLILPNLDGLYDLIQTIDLDSLPKKFNSPCVYRKKGDSGFGPNIGGNREAKLRGAVVDKMICFIDSMVFQSECTFVGEGPVFKEYVMGGSGSPSGMPSGMGGYGFGSNVCGNREARIMGE